MPVLGKHLNRLSDGTFEETDEWIELTPEARRQGVYVPGTTGVGKTTLLESIIYQDMVAGDGLCFIDPHGDAVNNLLEIVPEHRKEDVILFAPGDDDQLERPLGINLLACNRDDARQVRRVTSTVIDTLHKLFFYSWGPRMEDLLRNSILTLMQTPMTTFLDLWLLLASPLHRHWYTDQVEDKYLQQFWEVQFAGYTKSPRDLIELIGSSLNKIGRFLADPSMRRVVAQPQNSFSLREIMDKRKILLVNLSKGDLGEDNSALLGAVLVNLILIAALTRRDTPPRLRVPFHLIVDEFQNFATSDTFSVLQSEARKYAIDTIVAHQYRDQLDDLNKGSTLNVANFIVFRVTGIDAQELAVQFDNTPPPPEMTFQHVHEQDANISWLYHQQPEMMQVPLPRRLYSDVASERANRFALEDNFQATTRLVVDGKLSEDPVRIVPYHALPLPDITPRSPERAAAIRIASLELGQPKEVVDDFIKERIGNGITFDGFPDVAHRNYDETDE